MNKAELITTSARKSGLSKKDTTSALYAILELITETLSKGEDISFIGFGTFTTTKRVARDGVNPITREKIRIEESTIAKFKVGAKLKKAVKSSI